MLLVAIRSLFARYKNLSVQVKASIWFMFCSFIQKGIAFLTTPLFTRLMTSEQYGIYTLYLGWDSIVSVFATLNLANQVLNNGFLRYKDNEHALSSSVLGLSNTATTVLLIAYCVFREQVNSFTGLSTPYMLAMFSQYYFNMAFSIWAVRERYHFRYQAVVFVTLTQALASSLFGLVLVGLSREKALARVMSIAVVNIAFGLVLHLRLVKLGKTFFSLEKWRYMLKLDLPLIPHYLSMSLLSAAGRIMVGNICGAASAAFYSVPYSAAATMNLLVGSINSSLIPWFYQRMEEGDYGLIRRKTSAILVVVAATCLTPVLFGPELVMLLGSSEYLEGVWVMPPAAAGIYFIFLYTLFSNIELYYEKSFSIMVASLVASVLNIVLNAVFIPDYGFVAAGFVSLASYALLAVMHFLFAKRVCAAKGLKRMPVDGRAAFVISFGVVIVSLAAELLYLNDAVRYVLITIVAITLVHKRKTVLTAMSIEKAGGKIE